MESDQFHADERAREPSRTNKAEALGEAARRLPDAHKTVDRLHATWNALVSRTTPVWKKVLVALEAARLAWAARKGRNRERDDGTRPH